MKRPASNQSLWRAESASFKMRIRVYARGRMLGPGKMELLALLDETGSLAGAAQKMKMSYMRAWKLVQEGAEPARLQLSAGGFWSFTRRWIVQAPGRRGPTDDVWQNFCNSFDI